jgi:hypothetical protein
MGQNKPLPKGAIRLSPENQERLQDLHQRLTELVDEIGGIVSHTLRLERRVGSGVRFSLGGDGPRGTVLFADAGTEDDDVPSPTIEDHEEIVGCYDLVTGYCYPPPCDR